jgi:hypothetical protein
MERNAFFFLVSLGCCSIDPKREHSVEGRTCARIIKKKVEPHFFVKVKHYRNISALTRRCTA